MWVMLNVDGVEKVVHGIEQIQRKDTASSARFLEVTLLDGRYVLRHVW